MRLTASQRQRDAILRELLAGLLMLQRAVRRSEADGAVSSQCALREVELLWALIH